MIVRFAWDLLQWGGLLFRPSESLEAEILFLRPVGPEESKA